MYIQILCDISNDAVAYIQNTKLFSAFKHQDARMVAHKNQVMMHGKRHGFPY